jgi:hypothetical protein
VIDPVLSYSTYLGGSSWDEGRGIAVDTRGRAYVTGYTLSSDFPTQAPLQAVRRSHYDAFIVKLNAQGTALVYATYLGGTGPDIGHAIAVDRQGQAYVAGSTGSVDFPTTPNALQSVYGGDTDAFVTKFNAAGDKRVYSTYVGGRNYQDGRGIAVDPRGQAYITGIAHSDGLPATPNALQPTGGGDFDAFVAKLNVAGTALAYATYLGGSERESGQGIAVDSRGRASVTGLTQSGDFPTQNALQPVHGGGTNDAFITQLNTTGMALAYSTYLGGNRDDVGLGIAVDSPGQVYVAGETGSDDFPTTPQALQPVRGVPSDAFVSKIAHRRK